MKVKLFITTLALGFITIAFTSSCEKKTDCKLTIRTVDSSGMAFAGANVKLYANVKTASGSTVEADLKAEGVSDAAGSSTYTFKLPAILDIKAVSGGKTGIGIIKLEEGKMVEKVVTLK
ncbi:MAG: hypothetical protein HY062_09270 [Bacteroidetes bacterium]|nr:hypothetical protein [Bacteroidota bacterium]